MKVTKEERELLTLSRRGSGSRFPTMQDDWDRDGEDLFVFEVLEEIEPPDDPGYDPKSDLATLEELWLEKLEPYEEKGYNRVPKPNS